MGCFRLVLAFWVLSVHSYSIGGFVRNGAEIPVLFFISGFYMAMIYIEKYAQHDCPARTFLHDCPARTFLLSCILRLYPIYLIVLVATVLAMWLPALLGGGSLAAPSFKTHSFFMRFSETLSALAWLKVIAANLFVLGQDYFVFTGFDPQFGQFFSLRSREKIIPGSAAMLVPQGWSLSLELYFYMLVPFAIRKPLRLILLLGSPAGLSRAYVFSGPEFRSLDVPGFFQNYSFFARVA